MDHLLTPKPSAMIPPVLYVVSCKYDALISISPRAYDEVEECLDWNSFSKLVLDALQYFQFDYTSHASSENVSATEQTQHIHAAILFLELTHQEIANEGPRSWV